MAVTVVVPWRNRPELAESLPTICKAASECAGRTRIVNFGGDSLALAACIQKAGFSPEVVDAGAHSYFNKAKANNIGAHDSESDYLFFCDCDILIAPGTLPSILSEIKSSPGTFGTFRGVRETINNSRGAGHVTMFGYTLVLRTLDGRNLTIIDNEEDAEDGTRQAPGLLILRRADFLRVNGFNGRLHGWGWEDQDMISRLILGAGLVRITKGDAFHISHSDESRVAHYPIRNRWESRDRMFRQALSYYDQADFSGTYAEDTNLTTWWGDSDLSAK